MLNKITSWTGDFFLVYVDGGMLKSRTSMIPYFLKRNIVGGHKIFEFDSSYIVLLCSTPQRNSTWVSFFSLFTMHQNMEHEKFNIKTNK